VEKFRNGKRRPPKRFRDDFGHTPVSVEERIPWKFRTLITNEILFIPAGIEVETIDRDDGSSAIAIPLPCRPDLNKHSQMQPVERSLSSDVVSTHQQVEARRRVVQHARTP
jgi:hypothetical protein